MNKKGTKKKNDAARFIIAVVVVIIIVAVFLVWQMQQNNKLVARDDYVTIAAGQSLIINCAENDDTPKSGYEITLQENPKHGKVEYDSSTQVFVYTADSTYLGSDQFMYLLSAGAKVSTGAVNITIKNQLDAPETEGSMLADNKAKTEKTITSTAIDGDFEKNYIEARRLFHMRRFDDSIALYQGLIDANPENAKVSNCYYWIGECYYASSRYNKAIESFNQVLTFRKSHKGDDALMMLGRSYQKLGNADSARNYFTQLLNNYPQSEYIPKAQEYLSQL